jgi:hypothetical protein
MVIAVIKTILKVSVLEVDGEETQVQELETLFNGVMGRAKVHLISLLEGKRSVSFDNVPVEDLLKGETVCGLTVKSEVL